MIRLLTIIGARPQIIKAAAISRAINNHFAYEIEEHILHTGQHYDTNMSSVFFDELGIPQPHYNLHVGSGSHGMQTARIIEGVEKVLNEGVIRKTASFKDYTFVRDNKKYYYCYSVDMDSFVYDFEVRKLATYVGKLNKENPDYDIMYSSALCPQDGEDINVLVEKLKEFSKGDMDEKDTNS